MRPKQCYTIWFSQRTGSTLLNYALSSTGVAGKPNEWLHGRDPNSIRKEDIEYMWKEGTTPNGIFGLKTSFNSEWINAFRNLYEVSETASRATVWSQAFPNCNKHIYMTRRNKVRLAVSWWRAIVSGEWHRQHGEKPQDVMKVLEFLNIPTDNVEVSPPALERLADDVAEQWVQQFRQERQKDWERKAW